ncbi:MAG TPA: site-specific DNA-methyltransferase [Acidimicrobiales bacterium]|nr:site-specific DNA-methyltransferase [Acidimicrobiales bacterium]
MTGIRLESVPRNTVLVGDALTQLRRLPAASVDCVVTSPPYHLLRHYGGGPQEIGTEGTVTEYVERLVEVTDELARVLKPSGCLWLNLGDSYSRHRRYGAPPKSLLLAPERLLLALSERGWIVRNKVVWAKTTTMPASVKDRLACTWEPVYFLVRSRHYHFDLDVIRQPHRSRRRPARSAARTKYTGGRRAGWAGPLAGANDGLLRLRLRGLSGHELGKNPGDVWRLGTAGFDGAHFAVFPSSLVHDPIAATCPERVCGSCGNPWRREPRRDRLGELVPDCTCRVGWRPGLVLDPFLGSGTTALVAERMSRDWLGIELNPAYAELARRRIDSDRDQASPSAAA